MSSDSYSSAAMFNRLVRMPRFNERGVAKLDETLKMLEKMEKILVKKEAAEFEKAKRFLKDNKKPAAIQCLKRKRLYEKVVALYGGFQLRIRDEIILLEGAQVTVETVDAFIAVTAAMKAMLGKTMDEINELREILKTRHDSLKNSVVEGELVGKLEELESVELEQELLQPAIAAPSARS